MSTPSNPHNGWAKTADEEDRVEKLIRSSGCWDNHISVVDCMGDNGDWRKCQTELQSFKECMQKNFHNVRKQQAHVEAQQKKN
ncbi:unnamed protein product [Caenorhabditis angaria]|uniref:CHCH domain-containing protein n=1 Tax=Caenorhabditis angaria TaxID=860376 RepID=A0A9P1IQB3_9PELO|nr:unnamed protein product [Caenorhabditis angaria]